MTKDSIRSAVHHHLKEFFDGYVVVGKVAGESKFVIIHHPSPATKEGTAETAGLVAALYDLADTITGPGPGRN